MEPTLNASFTELVGLGGLEYRYSGIVWTIVWDPNKAIDIGESLIFGVGRLERFYCIYIYIYIYSYITHFI